MGDTVKGLLIFASGLFVGSAATYFAVKTKYEKMTNSEIEEIRNYYLGKEEKEADPVVEEKVEYHEITKEYVANEETEDEEDDAPYIIEPDDFGMFEDYDQIYLTYYSDDQLADDNDELVEDVDKTVGLENLKHIGKYDDHTLHVRNDRLKADYEILRVYEPYAGGGE